MLIRQKLLGREGFVLSAECARLLGRTIPATDFIHRSSRHGHVILVSNGRRGEGRGLTFGSGLLRYRMCLSPFPCLPVGHRLLRGLGGGKLQVEGACFLTTVLSETTHLAGSPTLACYMRSQLLRC